MSTISHAQYVDMRNRVLANSGILPESIHPVSREGDLHDDIIRLCKARSWFYVHSRMDKRTTQACGVPDFIIAMDDGKTAWIECKAKGNKPSNEQLATITFLKAKGHIAGLAYNMADVLNLIYGSQLTSEEQPARRD